MPLTSFCVRCGEDLRDDRPTGATARGGSYAAAPGEAVARVAMFSTLLPQLPVADLDTFRIAFAGGLVALIVLVVIGAFPVALVGAAVLVPALVLIYVYSVDVYEDTPLPVIALTMVWGAAFGIVFGIAIDALARTTPRLGGVGVSGAQVAEVVTLGVVVPLLGLAAMVTGPLLLMRDRRYNDVVDGATFGVASAVAFVGAQVIAGSIDLFANGPLPIGEPLPWVARIVTLAVALPVVAAGAVGSVVGAFWLRYRSPVRDRGALGVAGRPVVALVLAGGLLVAAALALYLPGPIVNVTVQIVLAAVALLWLRRVLHLGLLEEAFEIEIGVDVRCANCGVSTARHTFCGNCGISLHALPKRRDSQPAMSDEPTTPRAASGDAGSRLGRRRMLLVFAVALGAVLLAAAVVAVLATTPAPPPACEPGTDCGGPPPAAEISAALRSVPGPGSAAPAPPMVADAGIRAGVPWRSSEHAYEFEYSDWWGVDSADGIGADLLFQGAGNAELIVAAVPASEASAQAYLDHWFGALRDWAPDIRADTRNRNEILGPSIGFVDGVAQTYAGSKTSPQGATSPVGISLVTASDGRTTAAVILIVWDPDAASHGTWQQHFVRGRAEIVLKTFRWGPVP